MPTLPRLGRSECLRHSFGPSRPPDPPTRAASSAPPAPTVGQDGSPHRRAVRAIVPAHAVRSQAIAKYGFEGDKPERLAGIEATWDRGTQSLLDALGIGPGWRCLEAGAGGGSIAAWMAERVAPDGSVLAVDLDTTHVEPLAGDVLEVRRHDLMHDELPAAAFDLVHERSVLSWLGDGDALDRLVASLAPGGWLLVEDFDWGIHGSADGSAVVAKAYEAIISLLEGVGYQRRFGSTLLRRLERARLVDTDSEARAYVLRGGSPGTAFDRFSMLAHRDVLLASGAITDAELDETLRFLEDPGELVLTPVLYAAWGRKPVPSSV